MNARARGGTDDGVTLVELIVAIAVGALFAGLLASLFASGVASQTQSRDRDVATGKAQVVTDSLQASIRNADAVRVDGNTLRARVATGTTGWECRGWALTAQGSIVYAHAPAALGTVDATWTPLVGQAGAHGDDASVSVQGGGEPFTLTGAQLTYRFTVTAGSASVPIAGSATAQAKTDGAVNPCW
jgi:prepilin-type N-terminal cleavage/methylation domain-containing protein